MKYLLLFIAIIQIGCSDPKYTRITIQADENLVYIPVTIGDTTIMMLWDIGTTHTAFNEDLAFKLGVESDTSNKIEVSTFLSSVDTSVFSALSFSITNTMSYLSKQIILEMCDVEMICNTLIIPGFKHASLLGNDIMSQFYYAVNLTDKHLTLSERPLSFAEYEIVDSVEFGDHIDGRIYKTRIESDTLNLIFDSGMRICDVTNESVADYDIVLTSPDSTGIVSKVFNDIRKRARADIEYYNFGKVHRSVYDSVFSIGSYKMMSYIPYYVDSTFSKDYHGYITYGFIARFDIFYYNPETKAIKLYKVKGYNSIMRDIPIWEHMAGSTIIDLRKK